MLILINVPPFLFSSVPITGIYVYLDSRVEIRFLLSSVSSLLYYLESFLN